MPDDLLFARFRDRCAHNDEMATSLRFMLRGQERRERVARMHRAYRRRR